MHYVNNTYFYIQCTYGVIPKKKAEFFENIFPIYLQWTIFTVQYKKGFNLLTVLSRANVL